MRKNFDIDFSETPFVEDEGIGTIPNRLNWRCEILLTRNTEAIKGKRILDIASHDGRFSYACLALGAKHVTGVEIRDNLCEKANRTIPGLGYSSDRYTLVQDDVFNFLPTVEPGQFDTVLCLGFFYHTIRQIEMVQELMRIRPQHLILDTYVEKYVTEKTLTGLNVMIRPLKLARKFLRALKKSKKESLRTSLGKMKEDLDAHSRSMKSRSYLVFKLENHDKSDGATGDEIGVVAAPSKSLIELIFSSFGCNYKELPWDKDEIRDWRQIHDYRTGRRLSFIVELNGKN